MDKLVKITVLTLGLAVASIGWSDWSGSAHADQNDERLDTLFAALQDTQNERDAQVINEAIWQIWMTVEDGTQQAIMNEGRLAMATDRLNVALNLFSRLIALAPDYAEAWNRRATVYFLLGELDRSAADVDQVLALEPRHYGALGGLAQIELARDNLDNALDALETALGFYPLMPGVRDRVDRLRLAIEGQRI
ncbi:MAG: tetratricopeptide repeat protein [Alphaproteobacteria bacterium]|nr:tetratricopeptide repeat protein [Alphaproteobacteria bacterium]